MEEVKFARNLIIGIIVLMFVWGSWFIVSPGYRGVRVTLGHVDPAFIPPGLGLKWPLITSIKKFSVRQDTEEMKSECFSADLQDITLTLKVLYRVPETSVVDIYQKYYGSPFEKLIMPRIQEATKEVTALKTAANAVQTREEVKMKTLEKARAKIGDLLIIQDIVIEDLALSTELTKAITNKMVQEQNAEKALFNKQQAVVDAETAVIRARGEAQAIQIQGEALKSTPQFIELKTVERWNGVTPQVVGSGNGVGILFPAVSKQEK